MMHAMQPPQCRHGMKEHVLEIDREVEEDDRDDDACPPRQRDQVEETKTACLGNERKTDSRDRQQYAHEHHVDRQHTEVVRPAPNAAKRTSGSYANKASRMNGHRLDKGLDSRLFNHSLE